MKKLSFLLMFAALLSACKNNTNGGEETSSSTTDTVAVENQATEPQIHYYGDSISEDGATDVSELKALFGGKDSLNVKLSGVVNSSCQKKGCWMKMDMGNGEELRVSFKDYGFFVPKNLDGETAIVEGVAYVDTLDVDFLRHLADDAGKSEEEIAAITEPEISLNFTANGVLIKS